MPMLTSWAREDTCFIAVLKGQVRISLLFRPVFGGEEDVLQIFFRVVADVQELAHILPLAQVLASANVKRSR